MRDDYPRNFSDAVRSVRERCDETLVEVPFDAKSELWDGKLVPKTSEINIALRKDLLWLGGHDAEFAKWLRAKCAKDILFWVNLFCFTYDPRKKVKDVPFITYEYQDEAIMAIVDGIRGGYDVAIEKSRDMGASWLNVIVPTHHYQFLPSYNFKLVSRNEKYVDDGSMTSLFGKIRYLIEHQPKWLLPSDADDKMMFVRNNRMKSTVTGESTTGEVGRGDRCSAILLDEFASFETKQGYAALASTQAATNCRIFNSTPKGVANAFYDVVHKTGAKVIRMHWSKHPEKNRGLYCSTRNETTGRMEVNLLDSWKGVVKVCEKGSKDVRKVAFPEDYPFILDGKTRSPWYDRECSRAVNPVEIAQELDIDYSGSDYQFFDQIAVEKYKDKWCRPAEIVGDMEINRESCDALRLTVNGKGHFYMFEPLNADGRVENTRRFVMGVDVSAGTGASNSTIAVYDRKTNEKVAEYANPNILPDDFGRFVVAVARFFNDALIVPDRSGPTGETLVRRIQAEEYSNIYRRRNEKKVGSPYVDEYGVFLNPATKTTVLQQYRDAIGHCAVINRSANAMDECLRFVMTQNGMVEHSSEGRGVDPNGARANHGDMVIADALATLALTELSDYDIPQEQSAPVGSLAWRIDMEKKKKNEVPNAELGKGWSV